MSLYRTDTKALRLFPWRHASILPGRSKFSNFAGAAEISPSSFYQRFNALTSMTPLQLQNQLRFLEARPLTLSEAANVAVAAV